MAQFDFITNQDKNTQNVDLNDLQLGNERSKLEWSLAKAGKPTAEALRAKVGGVQGDCTYKSNY